MPSASSLYFPPFRCVWKLFIELSTPTKWIGVFRGSRKSLGVKQPLTFPCAAFTLQHLDSINLHGIERRC